MHYRHFYYNANDDWILYRQKHLEGFPATHGRKGKREVEGRLTCELAWKLNKDKLIRMAYKNTFNALAATAELFWDLATEEANRKVKDDSTTNRTV